MPLVGTVCAFDHSMEITAGPKQAMIEFSTQTLYRFGTLKKPRPNPDYLSASGEIEALPKQSEEGSVHLKRPVELSSRSARVRTTGSQVAVTAEVTWIQERVLPLPIWVWLAAVTAFVGGFVAMLALGQ